MINTILELFAFLKQKKKLWLSPIFMILVFIGGLLFIAQGSVFAPFIYAIF